MKNKFGALLIALLATSVFFYSCSKDDDNGNKPPTKTELLSRQWLQVDLIAHVGSASQSIFDQEVPAEHQDDIIEFKSDGTVIVTEGATRENASDPDTVSTGTWVFLENETKITISLVGEDPVTLTIDELTATSLKGTAADTINGIPVTAQYILQAK